MPETTTTASLVLRKILTGTNYTPPPGGNWLVGLSTTTILQNGTGHTEPGGGSYSRQTISSSYWNDAENSTITNGCPIIFSKATSNWGTIKEIFIFYNGSIYFHQPLIPNITVNSGTTVIIPPESLIIKRDSFSYETG